jgi:hypothetical protein
VVLAFESDPVCGYFVALVSCVMCNQDSDKPLGERVCVRVYERYGS